MFNFQSVLGFATNGLHVLCILAVLAASFVYARRIGGAGPWLLGLFAFIDATLTIAYLLFSMMTRTAHLGFRAVDNLYTALSAADIMLTVVGAGLVAVAFAMMRRPAARS